MVEFTSTIKGTVETHSVGVPGGHILIKITGSIKGLRRLDMELVSQVDILIETAGIIKCIVEFPITAGVPRGYPWLNLLAV